MATAGYTTVVDRAIGDPLTEAIWDDQLKDNINQLLGKGSGNLLGNGGFEVWQRGAGPFTATGAYTADRWQLDNAGTVQIDRESSTVDASLYALKMVISAYTASIQLAQRVEGYQQLKGKTISLSVRVQQSVASKIDLRISDGIAVSTSATSATTGSFVTLTLTHTVSTSVSEMIVFVRFLGTGTFYIDNAMLVIGPNAAPYEPLHPADELVRCQRYYEVHGGVSPSMGYNGYGATGGAIGQILTFATAKAGTPTLTKNGTWGVTNCGQPSTANPSPNSYVLFATVTTTGGMAFNANSTDDTITAEYNI